LARLWREVFGEPPPLADDHDLLTQVLVESLPLAPPYELGRRPGAGGQQVSPGPPSPAAAPGRREDRAA